jgi:hypothetical protein
VADATEDQGPTDELAKLRAVRRAADDRLRVSNIRSV